MGLPGDGWRLWLFGELLEASYRPGGLAEPRGARPRSTGGGEARGGERASLDSLPGRLLGSMGLLLCLGGEADEGGVRLFWLGELRRLGDLEVRRLGPGDGRLAGGEPDRRLFSLLWGSMGL